MLNIYITTTVWCLNIQIIVLVGPMVRLLFWWGQWSDYCFGGANGQIIVLVGPMVRLLLTKDL